MEGSSGESGENWPEWRSEERVGFKAEVRGEMCEVKGTFELTLEADGGGARRAMRDHGQQLDRPRASEEFVF